MISVTRDEMLALPHVIDVSTAADVFEVGRSAAYEIIRSGQWPTPIIRIGRHIRIPTLPLLELVGMAGVGRDVARAS
jgi:hypothetical protein